MTSRISPPRATHDADRTDDRWVSWRQFFQPEPGFAPAHRHLLPTAFPASFKFRTSPARNHGFAFAVMTPSSHREGGGHGDIKRPIQGHTASVFCPKHLLCPSGEFWYSQQILHSRQLDILSCESTLRRGKLVCGHIRFHFMAWSWTSPPFINYCHTETCSGMKVLAWCTVAPSTLGRLQPQWICQSLRRRACPTIQSSVIFVSMPPTVTKFIELLCVR